MKITDFINYYNSNIPPDFPRVNKHILTIFRATHYKLFRVDDWTVEKHRKAVMDWLYDNDGTISKIKFPYFTYKNIVEIKNDSRILHKYDFLLGDDKEAGVKYPLTRHNKNLYVYTLTKKRNYFNLPVLFFDFTNLDLLNKDGTSNRLSGKENIPPIQINRIIWFVQKYGVDFIPHDVNGDFGDDPDEGIVNNYFLGFSSIWGKFMLLKNLIKQDRTIPYSKTKKKLNGYWPVRMFQENIIKDYFSNKLPVITSEEERAKDLYLNYKPPISILFEYLVSNFTLAKKCEYCHKYFVADRKDAEGCCVHHNKLLRMRRYRSKLSQP
ncbi:MAG: hypothetical protein Q8N16_02505 [bacterium]|nr:hypothetical protein [bacterium]